MNLLWDPDPSALDRYRFALGPDTQALESSGLVARAIHDNAQVEQVVIGADVPLDQACQLAEAARIDRPELGVILLRTRVDVTALSQALRAGVREVVAAEDHSAIVEALRRSRDLTTRLAGHNGAGNVREGRVVTVFSAKGGVGKTTLSTNTAVHLAHSGLKTLLVDLDLSFGDVAISLQLVPTQSVFDAVSMSGNLGEQELASIVVTHEESGLHVLCAPNDPGDADRIPVPTITEILKVARKHYDYVIVDTPPSFTEHVLAAIDISDQLVLIATLDIPAVKNLRVAIDTLDMIGSPKDARVIVLNRADTKVGLRAEDVETAIKTSIAVNIPNSLTVPASVNRGVPVVLDEPRAPVASAIKELVDSHIRTARSDEGLAGLNGSDTAAAQPTRTSLFRRRK